MFGPRPGSWWFTCESDPRWNCSGRGDIYSVFMMVDEARAKLEELTHLYGEPPDDCFYNCFKD